MMKPIQDFKGNEMRWYTTGFARSNNELMGTDGETYATLVWKGILMSKAVGSCAKGDYEFKWAGFLRRHVPIVEISSGNKIGELRLGLFDSGWLQMENGRRFQFKQLGWKQRWSFFDDLGEKQCTLAFHSWVSRGGDAIIAVNATLNPDLPILLLVGWYAMNMINAEAIASMSYG
jgi:hypothetical protein